MWGYIIDYWVALIILDFIFFFMGWYFPLWINFTFKMFGMFITLGYMIYGWYLEKKNGVW